MKEVTSLHAHKMLHSAEDYCQLMKVSVTNTFQPGKCPVLLKAAGGLKLNEYFYILISYISFLSEANGLLLKNRYKLCSNHISNLTFKLLSHIKAAKLMALKYDNIILLNF
jgi:hypothetical protein